MVVLEGELWHRMRMDLRLIPRQYADHGENGYFVQSPDTLLQGV